MARGTLTSASLNTAKAGVKVNPASSSGKNAGAGTAQSMKKIYNPPGPRDATGQTGA